MNVQLSELMEDLAHLRVRDPSFNAIMNEFQHLASPFSRILTRIQPATDIPVPGHSLEFTWEIFQENPETRIREPGDGENTLIMSVKDAKLTMPLDEGAYIIKGTFTVEEVRPALGGDGRTFLVSLREQA